MLPRNDETQRSDTNHDGAGPSPSTNLVQMRLIQWFLHRSAGLPVTRSPWGHAAPQR